MACYKTANYFPKVWILKQFLDFANLGLNVNLKDRGMTPTTAAASQQVPGPTATDKQPRTGTKYPVQGNPPHFDIYIYIYIYIYMRFANHPDTKNFLGIADIICSELLLRKSGVFDLSETRSPGRFPEGQVWFPGRFPGRVFFLLRFFHDCLC